MEKNEFRNLLERLRNEIEHTETVDEKGSQLLKELEADIHQLLERTEGQHPASTLRRWEETITHLEVDHPALTTALAQLLSALSNAGI